MTSENATTTTTAPAAAIPAASKAARIAGYVIALPPVGLLCVSAAMKFIQPPEMAKGMEHLGWKMELAGPLGVVEAACTLLFLIPQTAVLGAILLTGYLGGATATHLRVGDGFMPPVILGVLLWVSLYLRDPRLRALAPWRRL